MKMSDTVTGSIFVVAGVAIFMEAQTFPAIKGQTYGSSFFPSILGIAMMLCGLSLAVGALIKKEVLPLFSLPLWLQTTRGKVSLALIIVILILYILTAGYMGFCVTTFLIVVVLQMWMKKSMLPSVITALCVTAVFYILFGSLLRVPLPFGIVERIIY